MHRDVFKTSLWVKSISEKRIITMNPQNPSLTGITLLGLGPGDPTALTRQAWAWLEGIETLYLRTSHHP